MEKLTSREVEVLKELMNGVNNKEIADNLCVSCDTVKAHLRSIYFKLGVKTRMEAVAFAHKLNLIK